MEDCIVQNVVLRICIQIERLKRVQAQAQDCLSERVARMPANRSKNTLGSSRAVTGGAGVALECMAELELEEELVEEPKESERLRDLRLWRGALGLGSCRARVRALQAGRLENCCAVLRVRVLQSTGWGVKGGCCVARRAVTLGRGGAGRRKKAEVVAESGQPARCNRHPPPRPLQVWLSWGDGSAAAFSGVLCLCCVAGWRCPQAWPFGRRTA